MKSIHLIIGLLAISSVVITTSLHSKDQEVAFENRNLCISYQPQPVRSSRGQISSNRQVRSCSRQSSSRVTRSQSQTYRVRQSPIRRCNAARAPVRSRPTVVRRHTTVQRRPVVRRHTTVLRRPVVRRHTTVQRRPVVRRHTTVQRRPVVRRHTTVHRRPVVRRRPVVHRTCGRTRYSSNRTYHTTSRNSRGTTRKGYRYHVRCRGGKCCRGSGCRRNRWSNRHISSSNHYTIVIRGGHTYRRDRYGRLTLVKKNKIVRTNTKIFMGEDFRHYSKYGWRRIASRSRRGNIRYTYYRKRFGVVEKRIEYRDGTIINVDSTGVNGDSSTINTGGLNIHITNEGGSSSSSSTTTNEITSDIGNIVTPAVEPQTPDNPEQVSVEVPNGQIDQISRQPEKPSVETVQPLIGMPEPEQVAVPPVSPSISNDGQVSETAQQNTSDNQSNQISTQNETQKSTQNETQQSTQNETQQSTQNETQQSTQNETQQSNQNETQQSTQNETQQSTQNETQHVTHHTQEETQHHVEHHTQEETVTTHHDVKDSGSPVEETGRTLFDINHLHESGISHSSSSSSSSFSSSSSSSSTSSSSSESSHVVGLAHVADVVRVSSKVASGPLNLTLSFGEREVPIVTKNVETSTLKIDPHATKYHAQKQIVVNSVQSEQENTSSGSIVHHETTTSVVEHPVVTHSSTTTTHHYGPVVTHHSNYETKSVTVQEPVVSRIVRRKISLLAAPQTNNKRAMPSAFQRN